MTHVNRKYWLAEHQHTLKLCLRDVYSVCLPLHVSRPFVKLIRLTHLNPVRADIHSIIPNRNKSIQVKPIYFLTMYSYPLEVLLSYPLLPPQRFCPGWQVCCFQLHPRCCWHPLRPPLALQWSWWASWMFKSQESVSSDENKDGTD